LFSFVVANALGAIVYVAFTPLSSEVMHFFTPQPTLTEVSLLTLVNPLMYVILALPSGIIADKVGWKITVGVGTIIESVFVILRIFALNMGFIWLLIFQIGFSVGGPPVLASVQKMVVKWFPVKERTVASGVGILATFLGLMIGTIISPILYYNFNLGLPGVVTIDSIVMLIGAIIFFAFARESPAKPPSIEEKVTVKFGGMLRTRDLWILSIGFFAGFGIYFALLTLLASILPTIGILTSVNAGLVEGSMTLGGIFGCLAIPRISDALGRRKPFLITGGLFAAVFSYIIGTIGNLTVSIISALLLGFFVVSVLPVALTMLGEMKTIGAALVGAATGLTMMIGYIGAVAVTLIAEVLATPTSWYTSIIFLAILGLIGMLVMLLVRETGAAARGKKQ
jgi:MFS family permease